MLASVSVGIITRYLNPNERKVNQQIKSHVCANRFYEHIEDQKTAVSLYMDEQFGTWIDDDDGLYYDTWLSPCDVLQVINLKSIAVMHNKHTLKRSYFFLWMWTLSECRRFLDIGYPLTEQRRTLSIYLDIRAHWDIDNHVVCFRDLLIIDWGLPELLFKSSIWHGKGHIMAEIHMNKQKKKMVWDWCLG